MPPMCRCVTLGRESRMPETTLRGEMGVSGQPLMAAAGQIRLSAYTDP
jgi:hypothetical protein